MRENKRNGQLRTARRLQQRRARRGGSATSEAKAQAARENGALGGRPPARITAAADKVWEQYSLSEVERRQVVKVLRRGDDLTCAEWDALSDRVQAAADDARHELASVGGAR